DRGACAVDRDVDNRVERTFELRLTVCREREPNAREQGRAWPAGHEDAVAEPETCLVLVVQAVELGRDPLPLASRLDREIRRRLHVVALLAEGHRRHGSGGRAEPRMRID